MELYRLSWPVVGDGPPEFECAKIWCAAREPIVDVGKRNPRIHRGGIFLKGKVERVGIVDLRRCCEVHRTKVPENLIADDLAMLIEARCAAKFLKRAVLFLYKWVFIVSALTCRRRDSYKWCVTARLQSEPVVVGRGVRVVGVQKEYGHFRVLCNDEVVPEHCVCPVVSPVIRSDAGEECVVKI